VTLAPPTATAACLAAVQHACVAARLLGWKGSEAGLTPREAAMLADLMDAIHNLPYLIQNWASCNESLLRGMLEDFDSRYDDESNIGLLAEYDRHRGAV
jgi:hypothetical protein